ncbi:MAG: biotin-dependent carboxyltransferase family protein [Gemmatimonadota bacterium]|nr:biotin-dependent carboxyltransferase family protein [Gemmatimonadota bacterium]
MITVVSAPPFATIQGLGRTGFRDVGVPPSGLADRDSGLALNAVLGNDRECAMIEWALGGGTLRFDMDATVALGGADAMCSVGGTPVLAWTPTAIPNGAELEVRRILRGRFLLIAVQGGIDVPQVLGSRSTLLSAKLGGFEGRRLRSGDRLAIGTAFRSEAVANVSPMRTRSGTIPVLRGPQSSFFGHSAWAAFLAATFKVSNASDRTGYRLEGPPVAAPASLLPSEPACVGAIQVPADGAPIVIMHDGPTVGGYPKIAVIRENALARFAQLVPGDSVRFSLDAER